VTDKGKPHALLHHCKNPWVVWKKVHPTGEEEAKPRADRGGERGQGRVRTWEWRESLQA
jgi:hypothetical protein